MKTNSSRQPVLTLISDHDFVRVVRHDSNGQKALHAVHAFQPGDVICRFGAGKTLRRPTYLTVQVGERKHITLMPEFLQYINHSCAPSVFFDTTRMELICLSPLAPGDELTFFYPSTEWDMAQPFTCYCGTPQCLKVIRGAAHLAPEVLERYVLTDFIRESMSRVAVP